MLLINLNSERISVWHHHLNTRAEFWLCHGLRWGSEVPWTKTFLLCLGYLSSSGSRWKIVLPCLFIFLKESPWIFSFLLLLCSASRDTELWGHLEPLQEHGPALKGAAPKRTNACFSKYLLRQDISCFIFCTVREISSTDKGFENSWLWFLKSSARTNTQNTITPLLLNPGAKVFLFTPQVSFPLFLCYLYTSILYPVLSLGEITGTRSRHYTISRESTHSLTSSFAH